MRILHTPLDPRLRDALRARLGPNDRLIACDESLNLLDPTEVGPVLKEIDVLIHSPYVPAEHPQLRSDGDLLEWVTRGSFVLLQEGVKQGLGRAILLSNLQSFATYPETMIIDESWRPRPRPRAAELAPVLSERVFREFARQEPLVCVCLRLGELDGAGGTPVALAARALEGAMAMQPPPNGYRWWLYHIVENERFPMEAAHSAPLQLQEVT